LQFRGLRAELVDSGRMTERQFHDAVLHEGNMPVVMVRALLTDQSLTKDGVPEWREQRVAGAANSYFEVRRRRALASCRMPHLRAFAQCNQSKCRLVLGDLCLREGSG
jgi:hypothetical protein